MYIAYNLIKNLEAKIQKKIQSRRKKGELIDQIILGFVNTNQFFGIDNDPFAVDLARVTMMIARKAAHDRLKLTEKELPLDSLDNTIKVGDALFDEWPICDFYIGNPPFLGTHYIHYIFHAMFRARGALLPRMLYLIGK